MEKLTAIIPTFNEQHNVVDAIESVLFADEVIVIDSYSSDNTTTLAKKKNVTVIQHKFNNFSSMRNFAINQATNNWILFLDADERIPDNLKNEIKNNLNDPKEFVAFGFYRRFYFKGSPLKFSGYQTDKVYRLFDKNHAFYDKDKLVHETLKINGKTKLLKYKLDHYSYKNEKDYKDKLNKYAQLRAKELYLKKIKPNLYHFYIKPAYRFFHHYIIRLGFLDGNNGFKISKLNAYEVKQRYIELKNLCKTI
ncbi:MAG: glycosyltransferase family 2 protein [Bacteroidota bacterium]